MPGASGSVDGPVQTLSGRVTRVRDLTHDVRDLVIRLEDPPALDFVAGQFVSFEVDKPGIPVRLTRPYSIASPPSERSSIELLFNRVPDGPGSSYLYSLTEGGEVNFKGPAGTFVLKDYPGYELLFVATGTGIAPIRSMILTRLAAGRTERVLLYWGLRSERDLYYQDEFAALAERHPNFSFVTTLSRPSAAWTGETGRVQRLVEERISSVAGLAVYVCGNSAMIADVSAILRRRGLCPIHREQYYRD